MACDSLRKETSQLLGATCSGKKNGIPFYFNALCYYFNTVVLNVKGSEVLQHRLQALVLHQEVFLELHHDTNANTFAFKANFSFVSKIS